MPLKVCQFRALVETMIPLYGVTSGQARLVKQCRILSKGVQKKPLPILLLKSPVPCVVFPQRSNAYFMTCIKPKAAQLVSMQHEACGAIAYA